jgi:hypothetical protein
MKNIRKIYVLIIILMWQASAIAQLPGGPPDPPGVSHGAGGDQLAGGSAPLSEGAWLLIGFSLVYVMAKLLPQLCKTRINTMLYRFGLRKNEIPLLEKIVYDCRTIKKIK